MTIFYQQSGKRGEADFWKTLATREGALRFFTTSDLKRDYGFDLEPSVAGTVVASSLTRGRRFQIWGVPSGARREVEKMQPRDTVLLIGYLSRNALEDGRFFYAGRVSYVLPFEDFSFSRKLWGDGGFPLIFFMQGALISYTWNQFGSDFNFAPNYFIYGHTMHVNSQRVATSPYRNEEAFATRLGIDAEALRLTHDA